jgi:hypothetical protein
VAFSVTLRSGARHKLENNIYGILNFNHFCPEDAFYIGLHSLRCDNVDTLTSEAGTSTHDAIFKVAKAKMLPHLEAWARIGHGIPHAKDFVSIKRREMFTATQ